MMFVRSFWGPAPPPWICPVARRPSRELRCQAVRGFLDRFSQFLYLSEGQLPLSVRLVVEDLKSQNLVFVLLDELVELLDGCLGILFGIVIETGKVTLSLLIPSMIWSFFLFISMTRFLSFALSKGLQASSASSFVAFWICSFDGSVVLKMAFASRPACLDRWHREACWSCP